MATGGFGVNAIDVGGAELLLTCSSGGTAVHLSRAAQPGEEPRAALFDHHLHRGNRGPQLDAYDLDQLAVPRWNATTLCGRRWVGMALGEGGAIYWPDDQLAFAPSCRRCLALMDRLFPPPPIASCLPVVVEIITRTLIEGGYAEIVGVPGDQQQSLRKQVRALLRQRSGHGSRTYVAHNRIVFECEAIWEQHQGEHDEMVREVLERRWTAIETGEAPPLPPAPEWRLHWDTWAAA
jgi:hypothetical protein